MSLGTMIVLIILVAVIAIIINRLVKANKKYKNCDCPCDCSTCGKCNIPYRNKHTITETDETGTKLSD